MTEAKRCLPECPSISQWLESITVTGQTPKHAPGCPNAAPKASEAPKEVEANAILPYSELPNHSLRIYTAPVSERVAIVVPDFTEAILKSRPVPDKGAEVEPVTEAEADKSTLRILRARLAKVEADVDFQRITNLTNTNLSLIAEHDALRADLAAADQNLKTMLQAAGEEAERQLAAEKARADRAEARVRELEDEIVAWRNAQAVKFLGEAGEVEARPRRWQAEVKLNGVADAILATRARKGNNIVDAPCGAPVLSPVPCQGSAEEGSEGDTESPRRVSYFSKVVGPVTGPFEDLRICFGSSTADPRAPAQTGDLSVRTCARCGNVHTQPLILPEASHEQQQQGHHHLVLESPPGHTSEGSASSNPASCSPRTRTSVEPSADSTGEPSDPQARLNDGTKS